MTLFRRYDHVERVNHDDVQGLLVGRVHVFPKLDGTNASVWMEDGELRFGSRNRAITPEDDNAGFARAMSERVTSFALALSELPAGAVLYGEWLVPHTLKTYREEAWRRFWVFDVFVPSAGRFMPYDHYVPALIHAGLDFVQPLCVIENPSADQLSAQAQLNNTFLIRDGCGVGEGIVAKNYDWANAYGKQPWAKIVRNEFKEQNALAFGTTEKQGEFQVEVAIATARCTPALVDKTRAKIALSIAAELRLDTVPGDWREHVEANHRAKIIPRLLTTVYHDLVTEELWDALKEHRDPKVDFKLLRSHVVGLTKKFAADLFA